MFQHWPGLGNKNRDSHLLATPLPFLSNKMSGDGESFPTYGEWSKEDERYPSLRWSTKSVLMVKAPSVITRGLEDFPGMKAAGKTVVCKVLDYGIEVLGGVFRFERPDSRLEAGLLLCAGRMWKVSGIRRDRGGASRVYGHARGESP